MASDDFLDVSKAAADLLDLIRAKNRHPERDASVLCISRAQFIVDIHALNKYSAKYNWLRVSMADLDRVQRPWLIPGAMDQDTHWTHGDERYRPGWNKCQALAERILLALVQDGLVAVMSANFDYGQDHGFRLACAKLGIPFLVLLREHYQWPSEIEIGRAYYRPGSYRPLVQGVAVAGRSTKDLLDAWDGLDPENIRITGFPRLDTWLDLRRNPPAGPRDRIVLLGYTLQYLEVNSFDEALAEFEAAAERHRGKPLEFVIKCKDEASWAYVQARLKPDTPVKGVVLVALHTVLDRARCVIGYNTMGLFEGLLSDAFVIVPQWGGAAGDPDTQLFSRDDPTLTGHVNFAMSREDFVCMLDRAADGTLPPQDQAGRLAIVQHHILYDPDEPAAVRVERFVDHYVNAAFEGDGAAAPGDA